MYSDKYDSHARKFHDRAFKVSPLSDMKNEKMCFLGYTPDENSLMLKDYVNRNFIL